MIKRIYTRQVLMYFKEGSTQKKQNEEKASLRSSL